MSKMKRLECPLCSLTVLSKDSYFLQLHFEQAHSPGSPFAIKDDPEPLPPPLQPKPAPTRAQDEDSPSSSDSDDSDDSEESGDTETDDSDEPADSSQEERTIKSPASDRREFIPPSPTKDRINYHSTETSSPHRSTGKYHSRHRSATMHNPPSTSRSHRRHAKSTSVEHYVSMDVPDSPRRIDGHSRKPRKHGHRRRRNSNDSDKTTISRSILGFNPFAKSDKDIKPPIKSARLGKSELGPYAWEERMPKWLHKQLSAGPEITIVNRIGRDGRLIKQEQVQNETAGIIPILAQLSALDRTVKRAYYCHPSTLHVGKTPHEGGFCGYRNIHMLLSYIQGAKAQGHEEFPGRLPTILKIQDLIEDAWDNGINEIGRVQTGGIRDTRKYIGTPEAQAFFLNAEINCAVEQFSDNKDRGTSAHETLLTAIERYFARVAASDGSTICKTLLPPIYLQQPGHSLSIVGFERHYDGSCNLVVFDPMYSTSPPMHKLLGRKNIRTPRPEVMHIYRRGYRKLKKYAAYEILMLTATPPLFPAWDVLRQFPDCRFVYVFFRARSLGYDVYPEDYFLPSFPWQQYGGLWSCDDARFARGEPMKALMAQALQRITSEGTSAGPRICNIPPSPTNFFANSPFQHVPAFEPDSLPSWANESNNTTNGFSRQSPPTSSNTVSQGVSLSTFFPQPKAIKPQLSLLTDVGRRYPGFPTPLSPTSKARELFPSPISDVSDIAPTPGTQSPAVRSLSPMSFDGSELCDASRRCEYPSLEQHRPGIGLIDEILAGPQTRGGSRTPLTSPRSISGVTTPPASPSRCVSPRIAMLKKLTGKQDIQGQPPSPKPAVDPGPRLEFHPSTRNLNTYPESPPQTPTESCSVPHSPLSPPTSIPIANGIEFETVSPIDPSGTMLLYTSNRSVDSGLLGVNPLSEEQVAEYRFWRPCGRRNCGFGCGGANVGEAAAAKRLFREAEEVSAECDNKECDGKDHSWAKKHGRYDHSLDGQNEDSTSGESCGYGRERSKASIWAGRRLVTDWGSFLQGCEREGVAAV